MKNLFGSSSLIPLSKIANAPSRSIRILWIIFSTTMLVGLLICIGLVVKQYLLQQTIFQLDFSGKITSLDNCPSISICFNFDEARHMFRQAMKDILTKDEYDTLVEMNKEAHKSPWFFFGINTLFEKITERLTVIESTIPNSSLVWSSQTAKSKLYSVMHNFTVNFTISPDPKVNGLTMNVKEQVSTFVIAY